MKIELENGFIEYRTITADAELAASPYFTALEAKINRHQYRSQQYAFGHTDEVPRFEVDRADLDPIVEFVASPIVRVFLDDADVGWSDLSPTEQHALIMRFGLLGILEIAKEMIGSNRLRPATKKKSLTGSSPS